MNPIIRVLQSKSRVLPSKHYAEQIYLGPHCSIPEIGSHICIQHETFRVFRVEHILGGDFTDIFVEAKHS